MSNFAKLTLLKTAIETLWSWSLTTPRRSAKGFDRQRSSASTFAAGTWWDLVRHRRPHVLKHIKTMSNIVKPWTPGTETCIFSIFFCCVAGSFQIHHVLLSRVLYELVFPWQVKFPKGKWNFKPCQMVRAPIQLRSLVLWTLGSSRLCLGSS